MPGWLPSAAKNYIRHTEQGRTIRQLAKRAGCHASTILRQVRRIETRRDDPLVDEMLNRFRAGMSQEPWTGRAGQSEDAKPMTKHTRNDMAPQAPDKATIEREGRRILRRLCEPGACLAVARDMEKAVVVRENAAGDTTRIAVVDRPVAQAMAVKDWIACEVRGRISRYRITTAGRAALKRMLADTGGTRHGFAEAPCAFAGQHGHYEDRQMPDPEGTGQRHVRYNCAESPIAAMARRKDKTGKPFLGPELVSAAERLREDFELAQMGPRVAQNWDRFLTGGGRQQFQPETQGGQGAGGARERVMQALAHLGPGLGDVTLRVCCFLEGLEAAEKRMGWSARSGKIVLRIALQRLKQFYDAQAGASMIG